MSERNHNGVKRLWQWLKGNGLPGWVAAACLMLTTLAGQFGLDLSTASSRQVNENTRTLNQHDERISQKADVDEMNGHVGALTRQLNAIERKQEARDSTTQQILQNLSEIKATQRAILDRMDRMQDNT